MALPAPNSAAPRLPAASNAEANAAAPDHEALATQALDDLYAIDGNRPLAGVAGGPPAFAASARSGKGGSLIAIPLRPDAPARAAALAALAGLASPHFVPPLACGPASGRDGRLAWHLICPAPPGPALWPGAEQPLPIMPEAELLGTVLRPVAAGLAALAERGVTHRALRPDNLFRGPDGGAVLGCAWAAPPGMYQPAVFEPPYSAICLPAGRGDGSSADDVYALGVVLLTLATGRLPLADLDDEAVVARKLDLGCFQALTNGLRLPPLLADLLGAMLAEDPQHRPAPATLADPRATRARQPAKRPLRRAAQPLNLDGMAIWQTRMLALALARKPAAGARLMRLGVVDHWLRRSLGDTMLASKVEEASRPRETDIGEAAATMRAIAVLDPLAPLCWDGVAFWPSGLGPALAAHHAPGDPARGKLADALAAEAVAGWAALRPTPPDMLMLRAETRLHRALLRERGWSGGLARIGYALNPLQPCRSPLLAGQTPVRLTDLLPALDAAAPAAGGRATPPADRDLIAFIAARRNGALDRELAPLNDATAPEDLAMMQLRLLAPLQSGEADRPLPRLAGWLADCAAPRLQAWHNRPHRAAKQRELAEAAASGRLAAVLAVYRSADERAGDEHEYRAALATVARIDLDLDGLDGDAEGRAAAARRLGQEIAGAILLAALAVCAVAAAAG